MPTYVYETVAKPGQKAKRYEIDQRMSAPALTRHPETGEAIHRVITSVSVIGSDKAEPECGHDCGMPGSDGGCGGCCGMDDE